MELGLVAIFLFNIVDTIYVGQLGAKPLAAMGFTFPVTYSVMSAAMGFSVGVSRRDYGNRRVGDYRARSVSHLLLEPFSMAILTRMVVEFGEESVAAFGVGGRIEAPALIGVAALSISISPFVGQNYGAGNCDRIRAALRYGLKFSLGWGILMFAILFSFSGVIALIFNDDPAVIDSAVLFLIILPISYGFLLFAFVLPLAYLGSKLYGLKGIFIGMAVGNALATPEVVESVSG